MSLKRVKIIDFEYREDKDLVLMKVLGVGDDESFGEVTMAWPGSDFGKSLGVKQKIPSEVLVKFLNDINGKEINLEIKNIVDNLDIDKFKLKSDEEAGNMGDIYHAHSVLDQYPYHEILSIMKERYHEEN